MIKRYENLRYLMFVRPNEDNELIRESASFKRGRNKGKSFEFITCRLEPIKESVKVNGKTKKQLGLDGRKIFYNFWEHTDSSDFDSLADFLEQEFGDDDGNITSDKEVEVDFVVNGFFYVLPFKHYGLDDKGNVDEETVWNDVTFFMPAHRNNSDDAVMRAFDRAKDQLIENGQKYKADDEVIDDEDLDSKQKEETKEQKNDDQKKAGRRRR